MQYEALAEEVIKSIDLSPTDDTNKPCSIVVSKTLLEETDVVASSSKNTKDSSNRNSILSNSSVDSIKSDNNSEVDGGKNVEYGSSVFYVVWD